MRRIIPFVFLLLVVLGFFVFLNFVKIQKIVCVQNGSNCSVGLKSSLQNYQGKGILKTSDSLRKFLATDNFVLSYSISYIPFDSFKVQTVTRTPIVAFGLSDKRFALIDKDGIILDKVWETSLPKITTYYNLSDNQLVFVTRLMSVLSKVYGIRVGKVTAGGLTVDNLRGKSVIFPLEGNSAVVLGSLNLILSRLPSVKEATTIRAIDLRYKNPVLTLNE